MKRKLLLTKSDFTELLLYQIGSKAIFIGVMFLYKILCGTILWNLGRPAFTSGDLPFILTTWQGWLLVLLGFVVLIIYTLFDINATILLSKRILNGERIKVIPVLKEAVQKEKYFVGWRGALLVLYVAIAAPLTGMTFGITLTQNFTIPEFIMSVINDVFILKLGYVVIIIGLIILGIKYFFSFHFILLEDMDVKLALPKAASLMKDNLKTFIKEIVLFIIKALLVLALIVAITYVVPIYILNQIDTSTIIHRVWVVFFTSLTLVGLSLFEIIFSYIKMIKVTLLFDEFRGEKAAEYELKNERKHIKLTTIAVVTLIVLLSVSVLAANYFDNIFPAEINTYIVAHRCGGNHSNENSVKGIEEAIKRGASIAELDVQRTADGHYILNHDKNFERCCGVDKKPSEMTLAEIKTLKVQDNVNPFNPPTEVATMEEILDAANGRIKLYIELKGESAGPKMVDDIYDMISERNMQDQTYFISLKYDVLEYAENTYSDVNTGYLCYFSFGEIENMNCDILLLEAETATQDNIDKIHDAGKNVNVWTVNTIPAMLSIMATDADGIITDEITIADTLIKLFKERSDELRVIQGIF